MMGIALNYNDFAAWPGLCVPCVPCATRPCGGWLEWRSSPGLSTGHPLSLLLMGLLLPGSQAGQLPGASPWHDTRHCPFLALLPMPRYPPPPRPGPAAPSLAHWCFHCSSSSSRPSTSPTPPTGPRSSCHRILQASSHQASRRSLAAARGCWRSVPWGARHTSPSRTRKTITTWTTEVRPRSWVRAALALDQGWLCSRHLVPGANGSLQGLSWGF